MREYARLLGRILGHEIYRDVLIMTIATMLSNFFNYLYQLLAGRLLTPQEYGELFSLLSLFYIFSVLFTTINTSITKFTTTYAINGEYGKIRGILVSVTRNFMIFGILIYISVVLLAPAITSFLNIDNRSYIIALFASIPFGLVLPAYQGILRGLQRFTALGISMVSWALFKLLFGIGLILLGYGVLGGLLGVFIAHVATFLITLLLLEDLLKYREHAVELGEIIRYGGLAFLAIFAYTTMWNIDVILVKHYFPPVEAGQYSALSVLGKIVLFAPGAVSVVIFPKAAEKHERGEDHLHVLLKGLSLVLAISGAIVLAYALFPETIIKVIYGEKYLGIAPHLWRYGLAMMFLAAGGTVMNYALSINITKIFYPLLISLTLEISMILLFKSSLELIINGMIIVSMLALLLSIMTLKGEEVK